MHSEPSRLAVVTAFSLKLAATIAVVGSEHSEHSEHSESAVGSADGDIGRYGVVDADAMYRVPTSAFVGATMRAEHAYQPEADVAWKAKPRQPAKAAVQ